MNDVNWELIIFIIIVGLLLFAGFGIFIGTRISADKRRIRELESELSAARKDMETYRIKVNDHFKKTSELFTRMTASYKAVYLHLAEGAQSLCTNDAAMLKPADSDFLKLARAERGQEPETEKPVQGQGVKVPEHRDTGAAQPGAKPGAAPKRQEQGKAAAGQVSEPAAEEQPEPVEKSEKKPQEEPGTAGAQAQRTAGTQ
jgi:uncharacterized protein